MKTLHPQESLSKGLNIAGRMVPARPSLPSLGHILITTDGGIRLSATNLEQSVHCWIDGSVEREGAIAVPARTFIDLVNAFPSGQVHLDANGRTMTLSVQCGRNKADIRGLDPADFPAVSLPEESAGVISVRIEQDVLRTAIDQTVFASAEDETYSPLSGVLVGLDENVLTFAATDRCRLAIRQVSLAEASPTLSVIVPSRTMREVSRVCNDLSRGGKAPAPSASIAFSPDHSRIFFFVGSRPDASSPMRVALASQLLPRKFPDYWRLVPREYRTRVIVGTTDLQRACWVARVFACDSDNVVHFHFHPSDPEGRIVVTATSAVTGGNVTELNGVVEGEEVSIACNVQFILEFLSVIESPQIQISLVSPYDPVVFRPVGSNDFTYLVMPIVLQKDERGGGRKASSG